MVVFYLYLRRLFIKPSFEKYHVLIIIKRVVILNFKVAFAYLSIIKNSYIKKMFTFRVRTNYSF